MYNVQSDSELLETGIDTSRPATKDRQTRCIATTALGLALVACAGLGSVLVFQQSIAPSDTTNSRTDQNDVSSGKIAHIPLLQEYIVWQPEMQAIIEEDLDFPDDMGELMKKPGKFRRFCNQLFKRVDTNDDGKVDVEEVTAAFKVLKAKGVIDSMPNEEHQAQMMAIAGKDKELDKSEFAKLVVGTVKAIAA